MSAGILARLPFNGSAERLNFAGAASTACGQMRWRGDRPLPRIGNLYALVAW